MYVTREGIERNMVSNILFHDAHLKYIWLASTSKYEKFCGYLWFIMVCHWKHVDIWK